LNASIIKTTDNSKIAVGSVVLLTNGAGKKMEYTIVGSVEADPLEGKISDESPIGQALIGKKVNDSFTIKTPGGEVSYSVTEIK
jgi:transcription elongation factor GreA